MKQRNERESTVPGEITGTGISRRLGLGSAAMAVLGLLSGSAVSEAKGNEAAPKLAKQIQERIEKSKALSERMRNASSVEERQQIMNEQMAWQRQQAVEDLKDQLGLSDQEWSVIKPRLRTIHDLVHPAPRMVGKNEPPKTEVEQVSRALRELLREEKVPADQIKAKLTALRAAREQTVQELGKARQNLRQLLTLRQEALLVLNGLLD